MNILNEYNFSIIIPNYNWWKFIEWCLKSILNQSYKNYEIIIIDWKSTDNSHYIIERYTKLNDKLIWLKQEDKWISNWFNIWLEKSNWDFILYLWSDDYIYDNILWKINEYINHIINYNLLNINEINIFCDSINYWSNKNIFEKRVFPTKKINNFNLIKYWTLVWLQNIFFNSNWIKSNKLDENNKYSMDYEVYFRMIKDNQKFINIPEVSSINYQWDNISCKFWFESWKEAIKVWLKYSKNISEKYFLLRRLILMYVFRYLIKIKWLLKK